jgi:CheY-like chemotaxis protein
VKVDLKHARGPSPDRRDAVILLVEDEFTARRALDEFLTKEGYRVLCTASGAEGLDVLDSYELRPRLVILDIKDTLRFRTAQQSLPKVRDIPVIAVLSERADVEAVRLRVERVLRKPLDRAALLESIDQLL